MPIYAVVIIIVLLLLAFGGWVCFGFTYQDYQREKRLYRQIDQYTNLHIVGGYRRGDQIAKDNDEKLREAVYSLASRFREEGYGRRYLKNRVIVELYNAGFVIITRRKDNE